MPTIRFHPCRAAAIQGENYTEIPFKWLFSTTTSYFNVIYFRIIFFLFLIFSASPIASINVRKKRNTFTRTRTRLRTLTTHIREFFFLGKHVIINEISFFFSIFRFSHSTMIGLYEMRLVDRASYSFQEACETPKPIYVILYH